MDLQDVMTLGLFVGGAAYAVGQIISSRRRGQGEALTIALQEIEAVKVRADRLEREQVALQAQVHALEKENATLRELIVTRDDFDTKLIARIEEAMNKQTRRLLDVIRETRV